MYIFAILTNIFYNSDKKTHFYVEKLANVHVEYSSATFIARVNLHLVIQWKGFCKSTRNFFIIVKHPLRPFKTSSNVLRCKYSRFGAVLYYTSCWDCVGMKFDIVGIDPNCRHPKPRPTTPQDLFKTLLFLYQKENYRNTW